MTEHTQQTANKDHADWVLYDGDCPMCIKWAGRFASSLRRRRFDLAPLQTPWVRTRLGLRESELPSEMLLLSSAGGVLRGADAIVFLARRIWWAWPFYVFASLPGVMHVLRSMYRHVASHRKCIDAES